MTTEIQGTWPSSTTIIATASFDPITANRYRVQAAILSCCPRTVSVQLYINGVWSSNIITVGSTLNTYTEADETLAFTTSYPVTQARLRLNGGGGCTGQLYQIKLCVHLINSADEAFRIDQLWGL